MTPLALRKPIHYLLAAGRAVAEGFLRDNGQIPPVMLAISDGNIVLHGINPDGTRINPMWN